MAATTPTDNRPDIVDRTRKDVFLLAQRKYRPLFESLNTLLEAFEQDKTMTPDLKQSCLIDKMLRLICGDPRYHFPQTYVDRAKALIEHFEAINWGGLQDIEEEDSDDSDSSGSGTAIPTKRRKTSSTGAKRLQVAGGLRVIQPPADHPIWGQNGIMHGIALRLKPDGSLSKGLNPLYEKDKKDPKVHGHNGIEVGQWYPNRLAAIFAGAHGASQAGISGSNGTGAYSVVVSGLYEDLDKDEGDVVYYSGTAAHDNEDPNKPAKSSTGTRILHASLRHQRPLRLLRTSKAVLPWAPAEGIRYDGLYKVAALDTAWNKKGGAYERFKLVRQKDQISLTECQKRPTKEELRHFNLINRGYSGFGQSHLVK
ncbi:hypothetical protein CERZMDRAFT_115541 [Cercospora zeae-maydis SCOH1-5]|uniref:YDG domain-containing protein n=1 Tax=Cercospora zeae-maydis SCOH1-5 TaxID=717836 RepID=A0A6A6F0N5_9PEZI|nr:hypothetical protein CERZMDRAFT_115541 [Cercospora zeae-maydis SCOH1-5]